jgi:hypothetical protein
MGAIEKLNLENFEQGFEQSQIKEWEPGDSIPGSLINDAAAQTRVTENFCQPRIGLKSGSR